MINNRTERKAACPVCHNEMVLVNLRGISASSDSSVNGSWFCDNCQKPVILETCTQDALSTRNFACDYVIVFADKISDTIKAELKVSHCDELDENEYVSQKFTNTRSIKKAFAKFSGYHYRHECKVKHVLVTVTVNGNDYIRLYKPNELASATFARLERKKDRELAGFTKA
ncbi:MAG: hypothetical protein MJ225_04380 [Bacilli bacterium]|nr:hypothetical protein [Bacilli bacterium]